MITPKKRFSFVKKFSNLHARVTSTITIIIVVSSCIFRNHDNLLSLRLEIINARLLFMFCILWRMSHASGLLVKNVLFRAVHAEK